MQTQHNAAGAGNRFAFFSDVVVLDMAFGGRQALDQAIKQHLNEFNIVGFGNAGGDLDVSVTFNGSGIGSHDHVLLCSMIDHGYIGAIRLNLRSGRNGHRLFFAGSFRNRHLKGLYWQVWGLAVAFELRQIGL